MPSPHRFTIAPFTVAALALLLTGALGAESPVANPDDWPWWRGPSLNGHAAADQRPPTSWSESEHVLWRTPIAGRGHGSPIVHGDRVYLTYADEQQLRQGLLCLDRETGAQVWNTVAHQGGFDNAGRPNQKSSLASSTPASDGQQIYVTFLNDSAVWVSAVDRQGELRWQRKISDYVIHQGYGASPLIYGPLVIVAADNKSGGALAGLDRETGQVVWTRQRPELPNYPSPIIVAAGGRDQLIMTGCDLVTSLDPLTGAEWWEIAGATTECVTTAVTDGTHIFTSGGYPENHVSAVVADGSGKIAWRHNIRAYVPSLLHHQGFLFTTLDAGVAICLRAADGETIWKERLGGTFSSSPVLVGDLIYGTNESGETFIFKADPGQFQLVARNQLGDSVFATPTIAGGRIYHRVGVTENGQRQEYLYCLADR